MLIRTLPVENGNYGGILQAYALQTVVRDFGWNVDTDLSVRPHGLGRIARVVMPVKRTFLNTPIFLREVDAEINADLTAFVSKHMSTVRVFRSRQRARRSVYSRYTTFIAGSDQVWRPEYADVPSFMFDFLPDGAESRLISYAASFGTDNPADYSRDLLRATRLLAKRFSAISVREVGAIGRVEQMWGVSARQHVDPTMLLPNSRWTELIATTSLGGGDHDGQLVSYVLDAEPRKSILASELAEMMGTGVFKLARPQPVDLKSYLDDKIRYIKPPIEQWLRAISVAGMLVTDSFHGCVFAIIFNTPFVVTANRGRGISRFDSLLSRFGLEGRRIDSDTMDLADVRRVATEQIDWSPINSILDAERARGRDYLMRHL